MKKQVGECCVDSGQIMIVDPTYVRERDLGPLPEQPLNPESNWSYFDVVQLTTKFPGHGQLKNEHGAPLGYVTATGVGDGRFPIYGDFDEGKLVALEIRFDR